MGLSSDRDWTGREVNGVTLGFPVIQNGKCVWDGGVPKGTINAAGDVFVKNQANVDVKVAAVTAYRARPELKINADVVRMATDVIAEQL